MGPAHPWAKCYTGAHSFLGDQIYSALNIVMHLPLSNILHFVVPPCL